MQVRFRNKVMGHTLLYLGQGYSQLILVFFMRLQHVYGVGRQGRGEGRGLVGVWRSVPWDWS